MKKKIIALLMTCAMFGTLMGCSSSEDSTGSSSTGASSGETSADTGSDTEATGDVQYKISVILKTLSSEYWGYVEAGALAYAEEHSDVVSVDVKGPSSETAFDEMQNMIETDMNAGYDGLIIAPLQGDTAAQMVSGADFPIVAVDTNFDAPEVVSFVGTGNEEAARLGAIAAVEEAFAAGWETVEVIEIAGVQGDETNASRISGYKAGVEEAGGVFLEDEIQYTNAAADEAVAAMEAIMQNHPEGIAIICAHNDDLAMAAARAAADNEAYANTIFLGFNGDRSACEAILAGELTMSIAQMSYEMGYMAVETIVKALNGEEVEEFVDSGAEVISIDNAQERLDALDAQLGG